MSLLRDSTRPRGMSSSWSDVVRSSLHPSSHLDFLLYLEIDTFCHSTQLSQGIAFSYFSFVCLFFHASGILLHTSNNGDSSTFGATDTGVTNDAQIDLSFNFDSQVLVPNGVVEQAVECSWYRRQ